MLKLGHSSFGFLGGAMNVDRPQQLHPRTRTANYVMRSDRLAAATHFNRAQPEVLITHTCPAGIGVGIRGNPAFAAGVLAFVAEAGHDPGPQNDCGDTELTGLWHDINYYPKLWIFGHFHAVHRARVEETDFVCTGEATPAPPAKPALFVWDSATKHLSYTPRY